MFSALRCRECRSVFRPASSGDRLCTTCSRGGSRRLSQPVAVRAPFEYAGEIGERVRAMKYGNDRRAARSLGEALAADIRRRGDAFDVVTWAPTTDRRRRRRGFDQSESVARVVAAELGVPCRRLLRRLGSVSQTGRGRRQRLADAPRFMARDLPPHMRVLVVDDVVTTGATLRAAAHALAEVGARVSAVAVAGVAQCDPSRVSAPDRTVA